jgi:hypothetical protein
MGVVAEDSLVLILLTSSGAAPPGAANTASSFRSPSLPLLLANEFIIQRYWFIALAI